LSLEVGCNSTGNNMGESEKIPTNYVIPFDERDREDLRGIRREWSRGTRIMIRVLFAWIGCALAAIGLLFAMGKMDIVGPVGSVAGGICVFILLIIRVANSRVRKLDRDMQAGKKIKIQGIVDKKEARGMGGSVSALQYFLRIQGLEFWVDLKSYEKAEEGESIIFEYLPQSEIVLRISGNV